MAGDRGAVGREAGERAAWEAWGKASMACAHRECHQATIGNGHRQRSATAIGNDRQRPSATTGSAADQGDGAASKVAQRTLIESAWSVTATSWTLAVFHGSTSEE